MIRLVLLAMLSLGSQAFAFEHTKVLPKGVRNVAVRGVDTTLSEKTDASGQSKPLSEPLAKDLTFTRILQGETGLKKQQLKAFLLSQGFSDEQSVGTYSADLKGNVKVVAPVFSYGLTERLTLAVAVPYYRATSDVAMGFKPNEMAETFLTRLRDPAINQTASAREAADKYNNAVRELNAKLNRNNLASLERWSGAGVGDIVLAAKHRSFESNYANLATTGGLVAPTGRGDNPDILTDLPFGDEQWDVFGQLTADHPLMSDLSLSEYVKYTYQAKGKKTVRMKTADEAIEVQNRQTTFKLGNKSEAGIGLTYEPSWGLVSGVGYSIFRKQQDRYDNLSPESRSEWELNTDQRASYVEYKLGYSTLPAFQRGEVPVPVSINFELKNQIKSVNMPISNLAQAEFSLFF